MKWLANVKALLLSVCLMGAGIAWAQVKTTQSAAELQAKTDELGKRTFKRKNGDVLTFDQVRLLPTNLRATVLDEEMTEAEFEAFDSYMRGRTTAANARNAELDKNLAAIVVNSLPRLEEFANNLRLVLGAGFRPNFPITQIQELFQGLKLNRQHYMKAGLKEETYKFFESLAKLPDWPKKLDERQ